ncbi:MAG: hypothetical protein IKQ80_13925, partial [Clostridia bacterium]|nr:hypothetical protein [Clostridia bacterium]
ALEIRFRSISESVSIARTKPTEKPAQAVASMAGLFCSRVPIFSLNSDIEISGTIVVQVFMPFFAQQQQCLLRIIVSDIPNGLDAKGRGDDHRYNDGADCHSGYPGFDRMHALLSSFQNLMLNFFSL